MNSSLTVFEWLDISFAACILVVVEEGGRERGAKGEERLVVVEDFIAAKASSIELCRLLLGGSKPRNFL